MKFNLFKFLLPLFAVFYLSSCLDTNSDIDISTDPSFVSLTFGTNEDSPNQEDAVFTYEFDALLGDSVIVNLDSLPFQTSIDTVYPSFTFTSSLGAYIYFANGDSVELTGTDTINFSNVVKVKNFAADGETYHVYNIKVNVHQVEPELYVWKRLGEAIETENVLYQKTVMHDNKLFYYFNNGTNAYLSTSTNGVSWDKKTLSNFPVNTSLSDMCIFNGKFYLTQDSINIYSSVDGLNWVKSVSSEFVFKSLLFNFANKLWAVVKTNDSTYHFANSTDGNVWTAVTTNIPDGFPVYGFSAISFMSRTGKQKVLVVGGYDANNVYGNTSWSSENCTYWVHITPTLTGKANALKTLAPGASIISYDDKLLLFGSEVLSDTLSSSYFRQSIDEGYSWQVPDSLTTIQIIDTVEVPDDTIAGTMKDSLIYTPMPIRVAQSVVVNPDNRIYIVGGKDDAGYRKDVWTGKLNRLSFAIQ